VTQYENMLIYSSAFSSPNIVPKLRYTRSLLPSKKEKTSDPLLPSKKRKKRSPERAKLLKRSLSKKIVNDE
jgi:hypothetical protein